MDFRKYPPNTFDILAALVARVKCKYLWSFRLVDEEGALRLVIRVPGRDSYNESQLMTVDHVHPVPVATFNEKSWRRWIFERCRDTENHELGEWFRDGDERPFAPMHGPGENPYAVHEIRPEADALTTQDGGMRVSAMSQERRVEPR